MFLSKNKLYKIMDDNKEMFGTNVRLNKALQDTKLEKQKLESEISNLKLALTAKDEQISSLSEKYKKANTAIGGYTKGSNKYQKQIEILKKEKKDLSLIISKQHEEIDYLGINNIELKELNENFKIENEKMKGIIDNLNKLVSKKREPKPTVEKIINYDRKQPSK